jgi:hypothetical protein
MIRHTEIISTHFCRPCKTEFVKTWRKVPWFGDYSARCERWGVTAGSRAQRTLASTSRRNGSGDGTNGRTIIMNKERVLRETHAQYECACGWEWSARFRDIQLRDHWFECDSCDRRVWPLRIDLREKVDGPLPVRLVG